ncbi:interferon alpha/beta receptor 2-like [Trichomycterus rosablanca]|uniref:interferon alpha/beta receptor 2-like n=1 Tax=Trichomycterus rosablanca TaxID=2290929 RepID=UPI002F35CB3E
MDHVPVFALFILVLPSSVLGSHLPQPVNLTMDSRYFVHLLSWQAGPESPEGLRYTVKVCSLCESWKTVEHCAKVKFPLRCNLTEVFSDPRETYYINITAILGNETSTPTSYDPFNPVKGTVLASPLLNVSPCNESLCVYLQSPSQRLDSLYMEFRYSLNVTSERGDSFPVNTRGLETVVLKDLAPGLRYCVSVGIKDHPADNSASTCASTTGAEQNFDLVIFVSLCLLVLMLLMCAPGLITSGTVCLKTQLPSVLSSFKSPYKVQVLVLPTVEFITCVSLETNPASITAEEEKDEETDQEKEDELVAYEKRHGCEQVACHEEHSEAVLAQVTPEIQHKDNSKPLTEFSTPESQIFQKEPVLAQHDWQLKPPKSTNSIISSLPIPLETKNHQNNLDILKVTRGENERQKEQDESEVNVNLFSLTLRGQREEQQEEVEEEKNLIHVQKIEPLVPLFSLKLGKTTTDEQPTVSQTSNRHFLSSEEDEDEEEEEDYSGYMKRN